MADYYEEKKKIIQAYQFTGGQASAEEAIDFMNIDDGVWFDYDPSPFYDPTVADVIKYTRVGAAPTDYVINPSDWVVKITEFGNTYISYPHEDALFRASYAKLLGTY